MRVRLTFAALSVLASGGCFATDDHSCEDAGTRLEQMPILAVHPAAAEPLSTDSQCDSDGYPLASTLYSSRSTTPDVLSFYRLALADRGWEHHSGAPAGPNELTGYHRVVDGLDIQFVLNVQKADRYVVEVWAPEFPHPAAS